MLTLPLNDIRGVSRNSTMTLKIAKGWTYHDILLTYKGMKLTDFGNVRVLLNGQPFQRFRSVLELVRFNHRDNVDSEHDVSGNANVHGSNGSFTLTFDRLAMLTRLGEQATAIGTGLPFDVKTNPFPVNTFTVEIDIKDTDSVTDPSISASANVSNPQPTGWVVKKRTFEYDVAGAGEFQISDLPKFGRINRIFITQDDPDSITTAKIERDTYKVFERTQIANEKMHTRYAKKSLPYIFVIDPTERGYSDEGLSVLYEDGRDVQDFRIILQMAKAVHLGITVEYLAQLGN